MLHMRVSHCALGVLKEMTNAQCGFCPICCCPAATSSSDTSNAKATGDIAGAGSFSYSNKYVSVSASDSFSANIPSAIDGNPNPTGKSN